MTNFLVLIFAATLPITIPFRVHLFVEGQRLGWEVVFSAKGICGPHTCDCPWTDCREIEMEDASQNSTNEE